MSIVMSMLAPEDDRKQSMNVKEAEMLLGPDATAWDIALTGAAIQAETRNRNPKNVVQADEDTAALGFLDEDEIEGLAKSDLDRSMSGATVTAWNEESTAQKDGDHHGGGNAMAAVMVWVGILLDAIPESLVIGILVVQTSSAPLPFIIGVFLSNLPEAMSSSGTMCVHGIKKSKIGLMWTGTVIVTTLGSALGAILFPPSALEKEETIYVIVAVEGIAAGAMLTMIAQTMLPEAFEQGGDVTGLSCLLGFLAALCVKLLPV
jgi:zinc transporter ZupT